MTDQKPIEPLPSREFITETWRAAFKNESSENTALQTFAAVVAQWGFNQHAALNEAELQKARDEELEACCKRVDDLFPIYSKNDGPASGRLRAARRPKPLSEAEEALILLDDISDMLSGVHENSIRRALERLRELEEGNE